MLDLETAGSIKQYVRLMGRMETPAGNASLLSAIPMRGPGGGVGLKSEKPLLGMANVEDIGCLHR